MDNFDLRDIKRVPYEELKLPGESSSGSDDDDFIPGVLDDEALPEEKNKHPKKQKSLITHSNLVHHKVLPSKKIKVKLDFISSGQANKLIVSNDDPRCNISPIGTPVRCVTYNDIRDMISDPKQYFLPKEKGLNCLLPLYDPTSANATQFFDIESQIPLFDFPYLKTLTNEEIDEEIKNVEKELNISKNKEDKLVLVSPFDHNISKSISIQQSVNTINWIELSKAAGYFDVIVMDPPWKIQDTLTPTRGVALDYEQMDDNEIGAMNISVLQKNGFLFMWVVAAKIPTAVTFFTTWGYRIINVVNWIKITRNGVYAPSNGHYLQHSKETCIIGVKGYGFDGIKSDLFNDLILTGRNTRQSHKPVELYEMIEKVFPYGMYLEIFARAHNIRDGWVSIGLEVPP